MKISIKFFAMAMLVVLLMVSNAATAEAQTQGTFDSGVTWAFSSDGTLRISGNGPMPISFHAAVPPWESVKNRINTVIIENGVTTLPIAAFSGITTLTSITIGNSITELPSNVLSRTGITSIIIPEQITSINIEAFDGTTRLETVYFNAVNCADFMPAFAHPPFHNTRSPALKTVVIGDKVLKIPNSIFSGVTALTSLTIGNSVNEIGDRSFNNCTSLTRIVIPDSVQTIGPFAFNGCTNVTSISLGRELITIRQSAFVGTRITEITIPENLTRLWEGSFENSSRLRTVYFNAINCEIGGVGSPFKGSQALESIIFGPNVRQIPATVAFQLTSLESITIGSRVNQIGDRAFYGCIALEEIINNAARPQAMNNAMFFYDVDKSFCTLRVPAASLAAYRAANFWKDFQIVGQ